MTGQSETKHTPGELKLAPGRGDPDVLTEAGDLFAAVYTDERAEDDAARIVLTWNCHDELVAALREVMGWVDNWSPQFIYDDEWPDTKSRVCAALAKATSPTP